MQQAFTSTALREQEPFIAKHVDRFVETVTADTDAEGWSQPRDFAEWTTWFGFDFVGELSFGSGFEMLRSAENRYVWGLLRGTSIFLYYVSAVTLSTHSPQAEERF